MKSNKIIVFFAVLFLILPALVFYDMSNKESSGNLSVATIHLMIKYASLCGGIVLIILRLFIFDKLKTELVYLSVGVLNLLVLLDAVLLYLYQDGSVRWLHACLINGLAATAIVIDYIVARNNNL